MKPYKCSKTGQMKLFFKDGEIDDWMEVELRKAGLYPTAERPAVDIEQFVDRYLDADLDQYAPLGGKVLGETRFEPGKRPKILINEALTKAAIDTEDAVAWVRSKWRMTMSHEATHVLLHKSLFPANKNQQTLFALEDESADDGRHGVYQHLERSEEQRGPVDWREVQANKGMAALLMPKGLFLTLFESERVRLGLDSDSLLEGSPETRRLAKALGGLFDVSVQSVEIRLKELNVLARAGQVRLL
jgi:hypothetical protein